MIFLSCHHSWREQGKRPDFDRAPSHQTRHTANSLRPHRADPTSTRLPCHGIVTYQKPTMVGSTYTTITWMQHLTQFYLTMTSFNRNKTLDECDQFSVSILSVCYIEEKVIIFYEGLAPPWKLSQIVEIRLFRKFKGTQIPRPNHFPAGVLSKISLFAKMSVRTRTFSHLSWKLELGLKFQVSGRKAYLCD